MQDFTFLNNSTVLYRNCFQNLYQLFQNFIRFLSNLSAARFSKAPLIFSHNFSTTIFYFFRSFSKVASELLSKRPKTWPFLSREYWRRLHAQGLSKGESSIVMYSLSKNQPSHFILPKSLILLNYR